MNRIGLLIVFVLFAVALGLLVNAWTSVTTPSAQTHGPTASTGTSTAGGTRRRDAFPDRDRELPRTDAEALASDPARRSEKRPSIRVRRSNGDAAANLELFLVEKGQLIGPPISFPVGTTNADGFATIEISSNLRGLIDPVLKRGNRFTLRPGGIFLDPPQAPFDLETPPEELIELTLPPCSAIEVWAVVDSPTILRGTVYLAFPGVSFDRLNHAQRHLEKNPGPLVIPYVGTGPRLQATYSPHPDEEFAAVVEIIERNRASDSSYRRSLEVGALRPMLRGRMIGANGTPLSKGQVKAHLVSKSSMSSGITLCASCELGSDGRFRFPLPAGFRPDSSLPADMTRSLRIDLVPPGSDSAPTRIVNVPASAASRDDGVDLGDVTPVAPPIVASGRVVDRSGNPVSKAYVTVAARPEDSGLMFRMSGRLMTLPWHSAPNAEGTFEIRAWINEEFGDRPLRLEVTTGVARGAFLDVRRGARDVTIVAARQGRVTGSVRLPPPLASIADRARRPQVRLINQDRPPEEEEPGPPGPESPRPLDVGTAFEMTSVEVGSYRLEVALSTEHRIHLSAPFRVESGETTDLGVIDLRESTDVVGYELLVSLPADIPRARGGDAWLLTNGKPLTEESLSITPGRAIEFFHGPPPLEVSVFVPGCKRMKRALLPGENHVTLERGFEVELVLDLEKLEIPPGVTLYPEITRNFSYGVASLANTDRARPRYLMTDLTARKISIVAEFRRGDDTPGSSRKMMWVSAKLSDEARQSIRVTIPEGRRPGLEQALRTFAERERR